MTAQTPESHEIPSFENPHKGGAGPTAGVIIIVLLLIAGALYYGFSVMHQQKTDTLPLIVGSTTAQ